MALPRCVVVVPAVSPIDEFTIGLGLLTHEVQTLKPLFKGKRPIAVAKATNAPRAPRAV